VCSQSGSGPGRFAARAAAGVHVDEPGMLRELPVARLRRIAVLHEMVAHVPFPDDAALVRPDRRDLEQRVRPQSFRADLGRIASERDRLLARELLPHDEEDVAVRQRLDVVVVVLRVARERVVPHDAAFPVDLLDPAADAAAVEGVAVLDALAAQQVPVPEQVVGAPRRAPASPSGARPAPSMSIRKVVFERRGENRVKPSKQPFSWTAWRPEGPRRWSFFRPSGGGRGGGGVACRVALLPDTRPPRRGEQVLRGASRIGGMEHQDQRSDGRVLGNRTRYDYLVTMISVRIAELKAKLSEYLRTVRKGHSITVLDRETPIARIVPYEAEAGGALVGRKPTSRVSFEKIPLPERYRGNIDIVELLLEERQVDR
jgi:prevent-host-death family protein